MLRPFVKMIWPASEDAYIFQRIGYPNDRLFRDGGHVLMERTDVRWKH